MSVAELKERPLAATETVNTLRERLKQKSQGKTPVCFGPTDLVSCRTLQGHTGKVYSLHWNPEKNRIVSASQDGRLIVWNALTSQKTHAIKLSCAWVMTCAFSPTGHSVARGGLDSVCSIFDLNSPTDQDGNITVSRTLSGHKVYVSCCQYVPDEETHLITSLGDQTCFMGYNHKAENFCLWSLPPGHVSMEPRSRVLSGTGDRATVQTGLPFLPS